MKRFYNDINEQIITNEKNSRIRTYRVKKKWLIVVIIIIALITVLMAAIYVKTRSITGTWIRKSDDNTDTLAGQTVCVSMIDGKLQGVITQTPERDYGDGASFNIGDIKWGNITKTGWGKYIGYDLLSNNDGSGTCYGGTSDFVVSLNGKQLTLSVHSGDVGGRNGIYQIWDKVE